MNRLNEFLSNPLVSLVLGLLMIYVGLQDLGVIPGARTTGTTFSTLLGVAFIGLGIYNLFYAYKQFRKR